MSDRDDATGQFVSEEPELYGLASVEREAGYIPLPDPSGKAPSDELTLDEAAALMGFQGTAESEIRSYADGASYDEPVENPKETVTLERAARELEAAEGRENDETAELEAIRKEIDELRGVKPEAETDQAKGPNAEQQAQPAKDGDLDPELEKALSNPKIKEAIASQVGEAEAARQNHVQGLAAATQIAEASFFSQFPEFANIAPEQRPAAFAQIVQNDPNRAAAIQSHVLNIQNLFGRYSAEQEQVTAKQRTDFQNYARSEDARFETLTKGETKETMRAVEKEIPTMLKSLGVDPAEFLRTGSESRFLRSAAAQAIMVKAAKYDMLMRTPKPVASKPLPPVQRPGVAGVGRSIDSDIAALDRRLSETGSLKDARALLNAKLRRAS